MFALRLASANINSTLWQTCDENSTLCDRECGATVGLVWSAKPDDAPSVVRENDDDKVFAVIHFSAKTQSVSFSDAPFAGDYTDYF